ncbi:hypothetical protein SNOG_07300 [Parastagonospora nodorum SN15]|uniref:Uncharacterized protein n=1 Tax=Phaeosphaeria nodorum (strain SN15 / ATCC MYA-4574 / FGSC 10173) TaxID=321614 RepID=Q0ULR4_PHANO|nr:hypothetical protein SNOG_07300 [Parastagonospora nodorum SN15]EAT84766.1 hypothetical protein SNOG_07300 [Parastagonospora nodorum SN15]
MRNPTDGHMENALRHSPSPHAASRLCHGAEKEGGIAQPLDTATCGATDVHVTHPPAMEKRISRACLAHFSMAPATCDMGKLSIFCRIEICNDLSAVAHKPG